MATSAGALRHHRRHHHRLRGGDAAQGAARVPAHEDEHVACVDKPCDIRLSVPRGGAAWTGEEGAPGGPWIGPASGLPCPEVTLHEWLKEQVPEVVTPSGELRLCHQLDYSTSGLIVATKSSAAARAVSGDFERRDARKLYLALVFGVPEWDQKTVGAPVEPWP